MRSAFNLKRGFSLIEMIVYVVILVFMLAIVMNVVVSVAKSDRLIRSARNIETSAATALERINREAKGMSSIDVAASTLGTHPGRLSLDGEDASGNPRSVEFYLSSGRVMMSENGALVGPLTSADAVVTSLIFTRFATSTVEGVRTAATIESGTTTSYRSENFYSSALLR
jgi:prepilin-type N-terminal cleavage/methylation domain-containing protein